MPGIPSRPYPRRSRSPRADDGFALIEVMVSAVVLMALALATMKLIDSSQQTSSRLRSKSIATALAAADLNRLRQSKFATSTNFTTTSTPKVIDGVTFTVVSSGTWTSSAGILNTCTTSSTGNPGQYVRLTSTVTWPNMGAVQPVTAETLLVPRAGETSITTGNFTMKVVSMAGAPVSGVTVTINGKSLVTSSAGCVLFTSIAPGTYDVTYTKSSYVDTTGAASGTYTGAKVTLGTTASKTVLYDQPAYITPVTYYKQDPTTGGPSATTSTWPKYSLSPAQAAIISNATGTKQLFPWSGGYQVYAGACPGNNPVNYLSTFKATFPNSAVSPGPTQTFGASAYLRTASIKVTGVSAGKTINLKWMPNSATTVMNDATCESATVSVKNTTASAQDLTLTTDLPYGVFSFCVDDGTKRYAVTAAASAYNNTPNGATPTPSGTPSAVYTPSGSTAFTTTGTCSGVTG